METEHQDSAEGEEGEESEVQSSEQEQDKESVESTRLLKLLASGNMEERAREGLLSSKAKSFHIAKHGYYRKTRVDSVAQEMQSALPAGVLNVHEDTDEDDDAFDEMEIERERDELRVAEHWVNQEGWDSAVEGVAFSRKGGRDVDLRLDWDDVKRKLAHGAGGEGASTLRQSTGILDEAEILRDYPLDALDPVQRVFVDRVLAWAREVVAVYKQVHATGVFRNVPVLRSFLGGSAGSGKSTT